MLERSGHSVSGAKRGEHQMKKYVGAFAAATMLAASVAISMSCASAAPLSGALALKNATPNDVLSVGGWGGGHGWGGGPGWRGGCCWRGPGWGAVGAGVVAGALIGAAVAGPPVVYGPPAVYAPPPPGYYAPPPPAYGSPQATLPLK
jgi:hypothetical protein